MEARRVGSLSTGLRVLESLAAIPNGASVTDLARELDLDKGYLHRLLRTLEQLGYVEQNSSTKIFRPTVKFVALASVILQNLDVLISAPPVMRRLLMSSGEAVHLARRIKTGGVYVAQERPSQRVSVETEIGSQPELYCTATGKALLAFLDDIEVRALVDEPFVQYTHRTIADFEGLSRDLASVRTRGYAVDDEERNSGVRCVAAPIFDIMGVTVASIGISGPTTRLGVERVPELGALVLAAAIEITSQIGGRSPSGFPQSHLAPADERPVDLDTNRTQRARESSTGVA
jgi:DNA-binding IclR family transcriptional regulator